MHRVRRRAHLVAARSEGSTDFNPFSRVRSRNSHSNALGRNRDVENGMYPTQSESSVPHALEEERYEHGKRANQEFGPPPHADTEPASATSNGPIHYPSPSKKESADISDKTAVESDTTGPKHRFKNLRFLHHDKGDEKQEAARPKRHEEETLTPEERMERSLKRKIPIGSQIKSVLFESWINILLVAVPIGFALYYTHAKPIPVFVVNFIAIIPLAAMLSGATEELAIRMGEVLGGLLNASFGNAVELIVSIQALIKNEIVIVKTSLIGSMLSNLLLVLGMAFFVGGMKRQEQNFNVVVATTSASILALCVASLIIPTVFHNMLQEDAAPDGSKNQELSRGTAIILLFVYGCYLFFQLKSHATVYNAPSEKTPKRKSKKIAKGKARFGIAAIGASTAAVAGGEVNSKKLVKEDDEEDDDDDDLIDEPRLTVIGALVTLAISTTMVAFCSEFMVSSIDGLTKEAHISTTFVGLILLPIVGNAAEHATAVTVAYKDKMDLSIGVAVGSSMQIALLVLPLAVILGWILDKPCMALYFDTFQIAILFVAVLLVNYLIGDGKSHWLEGVLLMSSYLIIALAAWFYPDIQEEKC